MARLDGQCLECWGSRIAFCQDTWTGWLRGGTYYCNTIVYLSLFINVKVSSGQNSQTKNVAGRDYCSGSCACERCQPGLFKFSIRLQTSSILCIFNFEWISNSSFLCLVATVKDGAVTSTPQNQAGRTLLSRHIQPLIVKTARIKITARYMWHLRKKPSQTHHLLPPLPSSNLQPTSEQRLLQQNLILSCNESQARFVAVFSLVVEVVSN